MSDRSTASENAIMLGQRWSRYLEDACTMESLATSVAPVTNSDVFMSCDVWYIFVLPVVGAQEAMRFLDDYEIRVWHVEISLVHVTAKPGSLSRSNSLGAGLRL